MSGPEVWRLVATATAFVLVMSLVIAVVAWTSTDVTWHVEAPRLETIETAAVRMAAVAPQASAMATPPPYVVTACHGQVRGLLARDPVGQTLRTGVVAGEPLYGLDPQQQRDTRYRAAYARCLRSRGFGG
jgi:hypothetical protein